TEQGRQAIRPPRRPGSVQTGSRRGEIAGVRSPHQGQDRGQEGRWRPRRSQKLMPPRKDKGATTDNASAVGSGRPSDVHYEPDPDQLVHVPHLVRPAPLPPDEHSAATELGEVPVGPPVED